jgi:cyclopropane-fatty-acyl-phospholipid synthase
MNSLTLDLQAGLDTIPGPERLKTAQFPATARWVLKLLERFDHGTLLITFPDGQRARIGHGRPQADVTLANWNVFGAALKSGDIGFAESYAAGDWSTTDPARVLQYFVRNRGAAEAVIYGNFWGSLAYRIKHLFNRNTRRQAKKNITAHYDLGNAFYALWLDGSMTYSSALFPPVLDAGHELPAPVSTAELEAAQRAKYARVLEELQLSTRSRVLEIGCGWGGFAETAARAGHRVRGLTLSPSQLEYAQLRLRRQKMSADLVLQDYREERGQFDGIASIEMFEAVGEAYWPSYFETVSRCLKPGGRACIQTITIADDLFDRYRKSTDFIQQYIFPGGMLPSPSVFRAQAERAGLVVINEHPFGMDYARTLATWRARFMQQLAAVHSLGFDDRFIRIWEFYLAYCEAAFAEGNTDVIQFTLAKDPGAAR